MMEEFDDQKSTQGVDEYWAIVRPPQVVDPGTAFLRLAAGLCLGLGSSRQVHLGKRGAGRAAEGAQEPGEPNVQVDLADRVQSMSTQVLSRTRLLNLIQKFNLYPGYANSPDDQVEKMRDDIKFELVQAPAANRQSQELVAFKIAYKAPNPEAAQQVNASP